MSSTTTLPRFRRALVRLESLDARLTSYGPPATPAESAEYRRLESALRRARTEYRRAAAALKAEETDRCNRVRAALRRARKAAA